MKRTRSERSDSTSSQVQPEELALPDSDFLAPEVIRSSSPELDSLPLTAENLQQLPGSPLRQSESVSTMPKAESSSATPSLDQWGDVLTVLEQHGMFLVEGATAKLPHQVVVAVDAILGASSFNQMRSKSAERIIDKVIVNGGTNETSMLSDLWLGLYNGKSMKHIQVETVEHEWEEQGLAVRRDAQFIQRGPSVLDPKTDKILFDAIPDVKHPKPDITFGLYDKIGTMKFFNEDEMSANVILNGIAQLLPSTFHLFAIWEQKKAKPIELSQVQALRGGSSLVWSSRTMQARAGMRDLKQPGIDTENIFFSFCGNTNMIRLFVHYAEVDTSGRPKYIMQRIRQHMLDDKSNVKAVRLDLERILDWGTLTRLTGPRGVRAMLAKVYPGAPGEPGEPGNPPKVAKSSHGTSAGGKGRTK
ncbi:MAG: hypothetical protein LQ345_005637 [Seirophora villosa]|nr:MAG: hypothetical protein LQ345_005637 [Seirophora villosa]